MKKLLVITCSILVCTISGFTQEDERAKKVLDGVSKEMSTYNTIYIEFKSSIKAEGVNSSSSGKAWIKGNQYYYEDENAKIWNNTKFLWNLEVDEGVCYKTQADEEEGINPSKLLRIWEEGFKYQYYEKGSTTSLHAIKLFPKNPKESKYHTLIVKVNKSTPKIHSMTVKTKDGMTLYYTITKLTPNIEVGDSKFKFDPAKNPGVEVEEL